MKKLLVAAVLGLWFAAVAQADLSDQLDAIVKQPSQKKVEFSVHIIKADCGTTVYSHNASASLAPASNMKIITTAAALKFLGPNYEYKTRVGLLADSLVIIGAGDPLLGDRVTDAKYDRPPAWILQDITKTLKRKGVTTIKGVVLDSSIFDDHRVHPSWKKKDLNKWYACEVAGINYNDNCIEMTTSTVGGRVLVSIEPKTDFVKIINEVVAVKKGKDVVGAYRLPKKPNTLVVRGTCKDREGPFKVAIERPAAFFGYLLAEHLVKAGIKTDGELTEKTLEHNCRIKVLTEYKTPIADCLTRCNKNSLGLAAEALLKTIAANSQAGKNGGWEKGQRLISQYLLGLGIDKAEFHIDDASGLSRKNKLSANAVTKVLSYLHGGENWTLYRDSLAVGGVDGTIRRRFQQEEYKGKIFGKSGYISGVRSLSGICTTADGDYIFSILANNTNGKTRAAIDNIPKAIIDSE